MNAPPRTSRVMRAVIAAVVGVCAPLASAQPDPAPVETSIERPWLTRAVVRVPVAVVVGRGGVAVITDLIEVGFDRPLAEQAPLTATALIREHDTYRALTSADESAGFKPPGRIEVGLHGPVVPRDAGNHLATKHADDAVRAAMQKARGLTVPIVYDAKERLSRVAYGPKGLARHDGDSYFATVPERVLIDERGEFRLSFTEIGPFDHAPRADELPPAAPVFSRFADGTLRRGAFRRNYWDQAVHWLDDRSAKEFIFAPGVGYQFLPSGPSGFCGTGLEHVKPAHEPGSFEPQPMSGSESVPIRYHLSPPTIRTLTPTLRWEPDRNATAHHVFIREGAVVYDDLQIFGQENVPENTLLVPEGVLRPGMTYSWLVTASNLWGYDYRELVFATSPDAVAGRKETLDAAPAHHQLEPEPPPRPARNR